jgi:MinD-like ATPase involved in chromosome partitioning or flagellar assembly
VTVLALASVKHSPGVTTAGLALAAAWSSDTNAVLVEADPAGGDLAARLGLALDPGLVSLAAAGRHQAAVLDIGAHTQPMPAGGLVLVGPTAPEQAVAAVAGLGARVPEAITRTGTHAVIDCGRWYPGSPACPAWQSADLALVVAQPTVEGIEHIRARTVALTASAAGRLAVLLVGDRPYRPAEVEEVLALPVIGVIAIDPRGATAALSGAQAAAARRSSLVRSARTVLDRIGSFTSTAVGVPA